MVDPNSRLAREQEGRDATVRTRQWVPPQTLPSPNPQAGWVFRWIRTSFMGQNDHTNKSAKEREGWIPCRAEDHPEMKIHSGFGANPTGNIEIGGLVLCKAPKEMMEQREAYYRKQADAQITAVDNSFMQAEDKRMPLFNERRSETRFGRGNK
jgi:hypothetical protein